MLNHLLILLLSLYPLTTQETNKKNIVISLERTACYGTCPIYKIEIYTDNSGVYYGERFVAKIGKYNFKLTTHEISNILTKANEIGFYKMRNEYSDAISDLPTTYIYIKDKRIKDYFGAPEELKELEKLIDEITQENLNL